MKGILFVIKLRYQYLYGLPEEAGLYGDVVECWISNWCLLVHSPAGAKVISIFLSVTVHI